MLFDEYWALYEKCEKIENINDNIKEVMSEWNKLTDKLFMMFTKEEIIEALKELYTRLDEELLGSPKEQWENFVGYLYYCSDRMNMNRWCRLQLLLKNISDLVYIERNRKKDTC